MLSIPEDDPLSLPNPPRNNSTNHSVAQKSNALRPRNLHSNVPSGAKSKKLEIYRDDSLPDDGNGVNALCPDPTKLAQRVGRTSSRRRRAPTATYGDWFDGDDAELEKMVDEFENEFPNTASNISDRVRASVAELCGAIDDLVEGDANEDEAPEGAEAPSLREQLLDSWQGKSYYERLQMAVVDGGHGGQVAGGEKTKGVSSISSDLSRTTTSKNKPLASINLNVASNAQNPSHKAKTAKTKSISLLQPLYKNQNYMIPQKALQIKTIETPTPKKNPQLTNALAELTKLGVPTRKDELVALKSDLLKIIEVCKKKAAACDEGLLTMR